MSQDDRLKRLKEAGESFLGCLEEMEKDTGYFDWANVERLARTIAEDLAEEGINAKTAEAYFMHLLDEGLNEVFNRGEGAA